jgi:hypothetical protein
LIWEDEVYEKARELVGMALEKAKLQYYSPLDHHRPRLLHLHHFHPDIDF